MPRIKATEPQSVADITASLVSQLNASGTGPKAYLQHEHSSHTFGIRIPHLAFQWLVGGVSVLPMQRFFGISGLPKSFKSTLNMEVGNWFMQDRGIHFAIDNEGKTSATMMEAMTRMSPVEGLRTSRVFKPTTSIEEWQGYILDVVSKTKPLARYGKGQRVPIYISIDSLNGSSAESSQEKLFKEGSAEERGFPVDAALITKFFRALNLANTTISVGYVQHLVQDISANPRYGGPQMKEAGAVMAAYKCSAHIRVTKGKPIRIADEDAIAQIGRVKEVPVEGYELKLDAHKSCYGPDGRSIIVPIRWQYVESEGPSGKVERHQVMWYDWDAALSIILAGVLKAEAGTRLSNLNSWSSFDKSRLKSILDFDVPNETSVSCKSLGMDRVSHTEFGRAIRSTPELSEKIAEFLNISLDHQSIQDVDQEMITSEEE